MAVKELEMESDLSARTGLLEDKPERVCKIGSGVVFWCKSGPRWGWWPAIGVGSGEYLSGRKQDKLIGTSGHPPARPLGINSEHTCG